MRITKNLMKKDIHPDVHMTSFKDISTGEVYEILSTIKEDITVEISSSSHPFYTKVDRQIDTDDKIANFEKKTKIATKLKDKVKKKVEKRQKRKNKSRVSSVRAKKTITLKDMLKGVK